MKHILFFLPAFIILTILPTSCQDADQIMGYVNYEPRIVVEGFIENGQPATVLLSWSAPFDQKMDTAFLLDHVIRSAKVSVSDGEQSETLVLRTNWGYLPPYIYRSSALRGETGKSYQLTIEYRDQIISAETYIPEPVGLESYAFVKENPSDTIGHIHIQFNNTSELYYQITTRVSEKEDIFTPCLYGNYRSDQFEKDKTVTLQLSKGPIVYPKLQIASYFIEGDIIYVKFRTMPKHGYDFWNSWQNEVINGKNPVFPASTSLKSNIEGGIGIWCGYGSYTYRVDAR